MYILQHNVQQCMTMNDKKDILTTVFLLLPKVLYVKPFFLICSITDENQRLTVNNRENPQQPMKNCDFLISSLSHLKSRMRDTSITNLISSKDLQHSTLGKLQYLHRSPVFFLDVFKYDVFTCVTDDASLLLMAAVYVLLSSAPAQGQRTLVQADLRPAAVDRTQPDGS